MPAPTRLPVPWAADTVIVGGAYAGSPVKNATLTDAVAREGLRPDETLKGDNVNEALNSFYAWIEYARAEKTGRYGDGSDGDVVIAGAVGLSSDMYYQNLTVPSGQILITNNYKVFVSQHCNIELGGRLIGNGADGEDSTNNPGAVGGFGGLAIVAGSLGQGSSGGNGGSSASAGAPAGIAASGVGQALGGAGGAGGASNDGGGGTGGSGGSAAAPTAAEGGTRHAAIAHGHLDGSSTNRLNGGSGGGGGGGGSDTEGAGGGAGGGVVAVHAAILTIDGTVEIDGGVGGNGNGVGGGAGAGAGAGGGGGLGLFATSDRRGSGTIQALGGSGGTGFGVGSNGAAGANGAVREWVI